MLKGCTMINPWIKSSISMVERFTATEGIIHNKYDLVYCMKGFMNTYSELLLFYNVPLDLNLLAQSLVEKTNYLRSILQSRSFQMNSSNITQPLKEEATKEQILEIIEQIIQEIEASIEKESLILLKQQLLEPTLSPVLVKGLLENIRTHPHCKWVSYLLRNYFEF